MSKRAEGNWGCIIAIALLMCGCALPYGLLNLIWGNSYTVCFGTPFPSSEAVEEAAFFKLPASAHHIEYDADSGSSFCAIWVKFEIAPAYLEAFQASTFVETFEPTQLTGERFSHFMQKKGWVQPANSIAGTVSISHYPDTDQWIFVDTTDPAKSIVYIITNREWLDL